MEESDRAISPLYENKDQDSNSESKYCEEEEVILDQWPPIKKEAESEDGQDAVKNTPPRTVVFEETDDAQKSDQHTPPREVVYEETVRTTPIKERVGPKNSDKTRAAQRTKSVKERLGTRQSDRFGRRHVLDRIQPVSDADHSDRGPSIRSRLGNTNLETREAQRKSRRVRDRASSHQSNQRGVNSKEFLDALCGQKVKIKVKIEEDPTDSEEEDQESSKSSKSKPKPRK